MNIHCGFEKVEKNICDEIYNKITEINFVFKEREFGGVVLVEVFCI